MKEKIEELEKEKDRIFDEINRLEAKKLKEDMPAFKKKYLGTCWKYKNSYPCPSKPSDYFWFYTKIIEIIDRNQFKVTTFQDDGNGRIEFEIRGYYSLFKEHISITNKEYDKQRKRLIKELTKEI